MNTTAVVIFCGPHYGGKRHFGRVNRAVKVCEQWTDTLVIAGDANGDQDVEAFASFAVESGVENVYMVRNGHNTRGDAQGTARLLASGLKHIQTVLLVTDWYHLPRSLIALRKEIASTCDRHVKVICIPVWEHFFNVIHRLPFELIGCWDYLRGAPQQSRGRPWQKPDEEMAVNQET